MWGGPCAPEGRPGGGEVQVLYNLPNSIPGGSTVSANVKASELQRMRGRRRRGRDRFVVGATITLLVAGGATSGFALANRTAAVILTAHHTGTDTNQHVVPAPPANFDHFDFSSLWLAVNRQPSLPIHGQSPYLGDLDTRQVMCAGDPETPRAPA